jgi:hypothetical protein
MQANIQWYHDDFKSTSNTLLPSCLIDCCEMAVGVKLWLQYPAYCYHNIWPYNKVPNFLLFSLFIAGKKGEGVVC